MALPVLNSQLIPLSIIPVPILTEPHNLTPIPVTSQTSLQSSVESTTESPLSSTESPQASTLSSTESPQASTLISSSPSITTPVVSNPTTISGSANVIPTTLTTTTSIDSFTSVTTNIPTVATPSTDYPTTPSTAALPLDNSTANTPLAIPLPTIDSPSDLPFGSSLAWTPSTTIVAQPTTRLTTSSSPTLLSVGLLSTSVITYGSTSGKASTPTGHNSQTIPISTSSTSSSISPSSPSSSSLSTSSGQSANALIISLSVIGSLLVLLCMLFFLWWRRILPSFWCIRRRAPVVTSLGKGMLVQMPNPWTWKDLVNLRVGYAEKFGANFSKLETLSPPGTPFSPEGPTVSGSPRETVMSDADKHEMNSWDFYLPTDDRIPSKAEAFPMQRPAQESRHSLSSASMSTTYTHNIASKARGGSTVNNGADPHFQKSRMDNCIIAPQSQRADGHGGEGDIERGDVVGVPVDQGTHLNFLRLELPQTSASLSTSTIRQGVDFSLLD